MSTYEPAKASNFVENGTVPHVDFKCLSLNSRSREVFSKIWLISCTNSRHGRLLTCRNVVSRHVNCQLSLQKSRRASSERFHALPSTTLSNFHSDSLDRLLRNGLFVSRHGYWTELSGNLCWFVSRHGYWNVEKQKSCQLSISLQQSGRASAERVVEVRVEEVRVEDVRVVEVHFYPQVWH